MEEQQVVNTIVNIFNGSDRHDWRMVRDCFMFEVFLDYFSLNKKPGEKIKADEIVKGLERLSACVQLHAPCAY